MKRMRPLHAYAVVNRETGKSTGVVYESRKLARLMRGDAPGWRVVMVRVEEEK